MPEPGGSISHIRIDKHAYRITYVLALRGVLRTVRGNLKEIIYGITIFVYCQVMAV